jgi:hypothetical protein
MEDDHLPYIGPPDMSIRDIIEDACNSVGIDAHDILAAAETNLHNAIKGIILTDRKFKRNMSGAKTFAELGDRADFWAGYQRGLRRAHHGDAFGTPEEHALWWAAADADDETRRERGIGYRMGCEGVDVGHAILTTYPPTIAQVREVCRMIGSASQIAEALRMGAGGGPRSVRRWQSEVEQSPPSYCQWRALRELAGIPVEPWPHIERRGAGRPFENTEGPE